MQAHPWFGLLPSDYQVRALKHAFADISSGGTPDTSNSSNWADEFGVPWVAISDMSTTPVIERTFKKVSMIGVHEKRLKIYREGTLLYSMYASVGHVAQLSIPATINQAILALTPKAITNPRYAFWQLAAMRAFVSGAAKTGTQDNLNADTVKNFPFVLPPLPTQAAIAAYLDAKTAAIDALIAKKEQIIEELRKYQEAVIAEAVAPREGWRKVRLKHLVVALPKSNIAAGDATEEGAYPFYVSGEQVKKLPTREYRDAEAIILATGGLPAVHHAKGDFSFSTDCWALQSLEHTTFLYFVLRALKQEIGALGFRGAGIKHLDKQWLMNLDVHLPPVTRQVEIASEISEKLGQLTALADAANLEIQELKSYRVSLIAEAVTGK